MSKRTSKNNASKIIKSSNDEHFIENLYVDEIRNGFLVTSHRKKLWNAQIGLINEFARICKKHNLRWFATDGTLLGAARHRGFIPWDDDVDLVMLRSDYHKFKQVASSELQYPYVLDYPSDYRFEGDEISLPEESNLPLIKINEKYVAWPFISMCKIRDVSTTMIEFPKRKTSPQGIWIDIFPMDSLPPFDSSTKDAFFQVMRELAIATIYPERIFQAIEKKVKMLIKVDDMKKFLKMTYRQRYTLWEDFIIENFLTSQYVGRIPIFTNNFVLYNVSDFEKVTYLQFEKIQLPCPANYDEILKVIYGDWHQMKITHNHSLEWSVDIPYTEYFKHSAV